LKILLNSILPISRINIQAAGVHAFRCTVCGSSLVVAIAATHLLQVGSLQLNSVVTWSVRVFITDQGCIVWIESVTQAMVYLSSMACILSQVHRHDVFAM